MFIIPPSSTRGQGRDNDHRQGAVAFIATESGAPPGVTREETRVISKAKTALRSALDAADVESVALAPRSRGVVRPRSRLTLAALLTAAIAAATYLTLIAGGAVPRAAADA